MVIKRPIIALCFLLTLSLGHAHPQSIAWFNQAPNGPVKLHAHLFLSTTCGHCYKANIFFQKLAEQKPWLLVHTHFINQDKSALQTFYQFLQHEQSTNFAVPAIFFCDSKWVGFEDSQTTGKALLKGLNYCRNKINQEGRLSIETVNVLRQWGNASQFQMDSQAKDSKLGFVFLTALIDAITPCALFCLAALLAFLCLSPSRIREQLGVGLVFLLFLGLTHAIQQGFSSFFYQQAWILRFIVFGIGLLLLFFAFSHYRKIRAESRIKPNLLFFSMMAVTVFTITIYQQTCLFNPALIFEQWMTEQAFTSVTKWIYRGIYQLFYLLPWGLVVLFFLFLGQLKRIKANQKGLSLSACLMLASFGVIFMVCRLCLASLGLSFLIMVISIAIAWLGFKPD